MAFFTSDQIDAFISNKVRVDFLAKLEFDSETMYVWNGDYNLNVNSIEYLPLHGLAKIDGLGMNSTIQSEAITIEVSALAGQEADFLSLALEESQEANQKLITISMLFFDDDWQPIGNPVPIFFGFMQPPKISETASSDEIGSTQTITITAENAFFNRSRPAYGLYSDRDQQKRFPGDHFLQFASLLRDKTFVYPDF